LFGSLAERLAARERSVVLDLGPAQSGVVAYLNEFRCRLDIADLAEELDALNAPVEAGEHRKAAEAALPPTGPDPTDFVFCWDLVNYLSRDALTALMDCIADRARPGTIVHMLVVYSASQMPSRPSRYVPLPDQGLRREPSSAEQRRAPRYSLEDLGRCMSRYRSDRAKLLQGGMQEFIFEVVR
jgi:hypothetical protein